jgi:hypothetical protein
MYSQSPRLTSPRLSLLAIVVERDVLLLLAMALPGEPTAAQLAEFLQRNDPRHSELEFSASEYESAADSWTARERKEVVAGAKRNQSIRCLSIDVNELTPKCAKLISSIVSQLGHVCKLKVFDFRVADDPPAMSAVDTVLAGVVKSRSAVASLKISSSISAAALLKITNRYPDLEELVFSELYWDAYEDDADHPDGTNRDDLAMAVATAMGRLPSLKKVGLLFSSTHPRVYGLLSALHTAPTIKTLEVGFPVEDDMGGVVLQAAFVCSCTRTIETVIFRAEKDDEDERLVEVTSLFGAVPSFSPSIKEVQFHGCQVIDPEEALVRRAAKAMEKVESLTFFLSPCPFGLRLLERMPNLRKFSLVTRGDEPWEYEDDHDGYSFLNANHDLVAFCRAINRKKSLLEDLEIELQGSEDEDFPALARLLGSCRGRLVLKLAGLPRESCARIVSGLERLRPDLKELRLRFRFCHFEDQDYADFHAALQSNRTLRTFEYDLAFGADDRTTVAIRDLVEANATLQTLSFRELNSIKVVELLEEVLPVLRSTNRTLRCLGLHGEDLADDWPLHAGPVLEMLQENRVLAAIEGFDLADDDPVAVLLKQNRYGRRFLDADDRSPIGIWATVLANLSNNDEHDVMYKFLRAKPDLVERGTALRRPVSARGRGRGRKRGRGGK